MYPFSGSGSGSGSWPMIPSIPTHSNSPASSNQDHLLFSPQHQQQFYQPQPQFPQQQQQQQQQQLPPFPQQQQQQQQLQHRTLQQQQQQLLLQQQQQQQNQHHQSLASHFHLLPVVENLADVIETATRDNIPDALVSEVNNHFEKCQQLLNSISGSINSKAMTVDGQKRKLEESEQLLNQRRELIGKYRNSVEELIKSEP